MPLLPGGRSATYNKVTGPAECRRARAHSGRRHPKRCRSEHPTPRLLSPPVFRVRGEGSRCQGAASFFWLRFFSVPSFVSRRFVSGFAFVCFCFCFVLFFFFVCLCCARAWVWRPFACGCGAYACLGCGVLACGLGCVAGVRQGLEITWFVVVAGDDVVDVGCAHGACRVVPPAGAPLYLSTSGWWGGGWVEAGAFVVRFCEDLFPEFVPVCWQASASVGCGPWHVCRVPGGVRVVGWLEGGGVLVLVSGFRVGLGSEVGVSGGWRCSVGGSWFPGGGSCCGGRGCSPETPP